MQPFFVLLLVAIYSATCETLFATVYHTGGTYKLVPNVRDWSGAAIVTYNATLEHTGWDNLYIWTNGSYLDFVQGHAAGYAEGYVTSKRIASHYANLKQNMFGTKAIPTSVLNWFTQNKQWIESKMMTVDDYWPHVRNLHEQYLGLVQGYNDANPSFPLTYEELQILPADIMDVASVADGANYRPNYENMTSSEMIDYLTEHGRCSAMFKAVGSDYFFGHTTWYIFSSMTRIMKNYTLNYSLKNTHAKTIVFSSYPGVLASNDDFLMTDSRLAIIETSLAIMNDSLYSLIHPQSLLSWHRSIIASRLAFDAPSWVQIYSLFNSGTYCNSWIISDLSKPNDAPNFVWIAEQTPIGIISQDITGLLHSQGYFPSYNVPFSQRVRDILGYTALLEKRPNLADVLDYNKCARANIFRARQGSVTSFTNFKSLLRYNNYEHDPLSKDNPTFAIAARGDLKQVPTCSGGYDTKASSLKLASSSLQFDAISSPTYDQQTPFDWSKTSCSTAVYPRNGLPTKWNFAWQQYRE